jgi:hypothetical protein
MKHMDSSVWKGLMKIKEDFFSVGSFEVANGHDTRFRRTTG